MGFLSAREDDSGPPIRAPLFVRGKLILCFVWFILVLNAMAPSPNPQSALVAAALPVLDALLLIPYSLSIRRWPLRAEAIRFASIALSAIAITLTLHLVADFAWPGYILYFALLCIAPFLPANVVVGVISAAYLALVAAETSGLAPAASGRTLEELQGDRILALAVVVGLWVVAQAIERLAAVARSQYLDQVQLRQESARRLEAETTWSTIGKTVIGTQDLDQVLTTVIQVINAKMQVETGSVLLREPNTEELYFAKILSGEVEQLGSIRLRLGQGVAGWVAQKGLSAIVLDPLRDERWFSQVDQQIGFTTRSILCVPLIVKDETIGVIELLNKRSGAFSQDDLRLMESLAAPVAIAIQNARLHQQVQTQLAELTQLFHQVERAKQQWEHTIDAIDEGISLVDEQGSILRANRTFAEWVAATPTALVGQYCHQVIHGLESPPANCPHVRLIAEHKSVCRAEMDEPRLSGSFHCTAYPLRDPDGQFIGTVNVLKNITAEKRLQAQLIRSENLAATGRLATSLAHEINNPLQGLQGCLDLAQDNAGKLEKQRRYLTLARTELERLATIVRRILDLYRPSKGVRAQVDLRTLIEDILALCAKRLQAGHIVTRMEWDRSLPKVAVVESQIKQVLLNLVLNAMDAMPQGGELVIQNQLFDQGRWLTVTLTDTGVGIPPDQLDAIFEPFYTTKAEGTGLGLAVCSNILADHGGRLTVESTTGRGCTFTIWLPLNEEAPWKARKTFSS